MPEDEHKGIVLKTPEQLQNQIKWAQMQGKNDYTYFAPVLGFENADNKTIKDAIESEQKEFEQLSPEERSISYSPVTMTYERYLESLRNLRKLQREQVENSRKNTPPGSTSTEDYLRIVSYPQELARQLVENLEGDTRRIHTDEQVKEAVKTEEGLLTLVREISVRNPEKISWHSEELKAFLTPDEYKDLVANIASLDNSSFFLMAIKDSSLFTDEELKKLVPKAIKTDTGKYSTYRYLSEAEFAKLFTKEELIPIVQEALGKISPDSIASSQTEFYLKQGILTREEISQRIMSYFNEEDSYNFGNAISNLGRLKEYLDDDQLNEIKEKSLQHLLTTPTSPILYRIKNLDEVFTHEQLREVVQARLAISMSEFTNYYEVAKKYLSSQEMAVCLENLIANPNESLLRISDLQRQIAKDESMPKNIKKEFFDKLFKDYPGCVSINHIDEILAVYTPENLEQSIKRVAEAAETYYAWSSCDKWINLISTDPAIQKQFLLGLVFQNNKFSFVVGFADNNTKLKELFTSQEVKDILYKKLELGVENAFNSLSDVKKVLGSDREFRSFIDTAAKIDPYGFFFNFDQIGYLYNPQEVIEIIDKARLDIKGTTVCLEDIAKWGPFAPKEYVKDFILSSIPTHPKELFARLGHCIKYIEENQKNMFISGLIRANPARALGAIETIQKLFPEITKQRILQIGQENADALEFAPYTLAEFYRDFPRTTDSKALLALLKDAIDVYDYVGLVARNGLAASFKTAQKIETQAGKFSPIPKAREIELLSIFYSFALLKEKHAELFPNGEVLGNNFNEAGVILLKKLSEHMDIGRSVAPEDARRFYSSMGSPAPFTVYYLQHESSEGHRKILREMYSSILDGNFHRWKFAAESPEKFEALKEQKLIPEKLTYEQYSRWAEDEDTSLFESLSSSAESVTSDIRNLIIDNQEHLGVGRVDLRGRELAEIVSQVQFLLVESGQSLANINRRMSELRRTDGQNSEEFALLSAQKEQIQQERSEKVRLRNILKIALIKPEELASGYFLQKNERTSQIEKVATIADALKQFKAGLPPDGVSVAETIEEMIRNFQTVTDVKQNLTTTDSSDPKVLIEIGENPVSSCQHYAHGSFNDCLIGYSDPNTKIMIIRNEKGSVIARSIFRMLTDSEGNPALQLERIYSAFSSPAIPKSLYTHAFKKASQLGLKLYISMPQKEADQERLSSELPESFEIQQTAQELESFASRTPKVYVDAASGVRSFGQYKIKNLAEVRLAS